MIAPSIRTFTGKTPRGGIAALVFLGLLAGGAFAGLGYEAARDWSGAASTFDAYLLAAMRFTLWQAVLSTVLSVLPAIVIARAFFRVPAFPGRALLLRLFGLPLAIPAIVAALGILALYGRAGYLAPALGQLGSGSWGGIFGLSGILLAHVFFNLPLATRLFIEALDAVPADRWRLASQLGMGAGPAFRLIEWPALRAALPGIAGLVFMLCVTSFTIVLTLGGGPAATTLEVAIYQALRFDFDPARAVMLALLQVALTGAVLMVLARLGAPMAGEANLTVSRRAFALPSSRVERTAHGLLLAAATLFVAGPLAAIVAAGLGADLLRLAGEAQVQRAIITSITLAFFAACLALALSLALVRLRQRLEHARRGQPSGWLEWWAGNGSSLILVVPPIVMGAGWFVMLRHTGHLFAFAPVMVVTVNTAMAMPFAMRVLRPALDSAATRHDRLVANLGITGWARLRLIDWPVLRAPVLTAFAFSMALSLGDLGVIALFGSNEVQTLPWLLLARMGSYRTADAAGLALILTVLCLGLMAFAARSNAGVQPR